MHGWGAPPPPPGHEREGPDGRGGPNGPPPGMVMGPQGALFGFGGPHGQGHPGGPPMGYNMMPNMIPQGMQMQGNALAYMPWFPQMAPMGQMGMQGYGMGGIPGMPIPGGELGGTDDAQRKRRERDETNMKWASLDSLAPPASSIQGGHRSQSLRSGRTKLEVLEAVVDKVRGLTRLGTCLREAFAINEDVGVLIVDLATSKVKHASKAFDRMGSWLTPSGVDGMQGLLLSSLLHPDDSPKFRQLAAECHSGLDAMRRAAPQEQARAVSVRMLQRPPPGPSGQRGPDWLLSYTQPITLSLASIGAVGKPRGTPNDSLYAVLVADLGSQQAMVEHEPEGHAAHVRSLADAGMLSHTFDLQWEPSGLDPFQMLTACAGWGRPAPAKGSKNNSGLVASAARRVPAKAPGLALKKTSKALAQMSIKRADDGSDRLEMICDVAVDFLDGGSYRRAERMMMDALEKTAPPPTAFATPDISKLPEGNSGVVMAPGVEGVIKAKPTSSGRLQKVMVVSDPGTEQEEGSVRFVILSLPASGRAEERKKDAEIRVDMDISANAINISADLVGPWSRGTPQDRYTASGKAQGKPYWDKDTMDEQWEAVRTALLPAGIPDDGVTHGEYPGGALPRGCWHLVEPPPELE